MKKTKDSAYAYAYGVVSSMTGKLLDEKTYDELARFRSVEEVLAFMEGTDYEHEIKKVVGKTIRIKDVENALKSHFIRVYEGIVSSIPDTDRAEFNKVILEGLRFENLKVILRGIHSELGSEKIIETLETSMDSKLMAELAESKDLEEFAEKLESMEYHYVMKEELEKYKETGDLLPLENAIDKYLVNSWSKISCIEIKEFTDIRTDMINIMTILRCKISDIPTKDYVIYGGTLKEHLKEIEKGDIKDVLSSLDKTSYGAAVREAMNEYEKTSSLVTLEWKMESNVMKYLKENAMLKPLGISSIMLFINAKRREVNVKYASCKRNAFT